MAASFRYFCVEYNSARYSSPSSLFPECVARVPLSLSGCGGRAVFARRCVYVRNRSQPSAWGPYGRAYRKLCKRGHFGIYLASRNFISRGRRGTSWHSNMSQDASKVVLCGRHNTFCYIFRRCVAFFVASATLWTPLISFCVAGATL